VEQAVLAGKLDARDYQRNRDDYLAVEWHTPKWAWVDPEKDVRAEIMAIRAGLKARSMSINETGLDEEEVDAQIARDNERTDRLGLVLDSDPRKTDARGQAANVLETGGGGEGLDSGAPTESKPEPPKPKRKEPKK
jgi:capsid protein